MKIFSLKNRYRATSVFALALAFLLIGGSVAYATLTFDATSMTGSTTVDITGAAGSAITIGAAAQLGTISMGTSTGALTLNLGTGASGVKTIHIGDGSSANVITIGGAASSTTITGTLGTVTLFDAASTISSGVTSGATLTAMKFAPQASVAVGGITQQHHLVTFGDSTGGLTAYGFGDPTVKTYGVVADFGRTVIATSSFTGTDTALDVRAINALANDAAYTMQGAYIAAKNNTGGTVGGVKGLDLEYRNDGTNPNASTVIGLNIRNTGSSVAAQGGHSDIKLSTGAVITTGSATTDGSIKTDVGTLPAGSIYISTNGAGEIWIMQTTTWTKLTIP